MGTRDEKEKQKIRRETLGKHFFNLSLATFTVVVLGSIVNIFGVGKTNLLLTSGALTFGALLTFGFAYVGNIILKK